MNTNDIIKDFISVILKKVGSFNKTRFYSGGARWFFGLMILVWVGGCSLPYTVIKDYESRKPRTIALLPALNYTNDLDAPGETRPLIHHALIDRGYWVQSSGETDSLLKSKEITQAGQIYTMTYQELGQLLGTDALLVSTVLDWSTVYLIAYSSVTVEAKFELIDSRTQEKLWVSQDKISKRNIATDKDSIMKTLDDAINISYASLAEELIKRCFASLPYGENPKPKRHGKPLHWKIILEKK